MNKIIRENLADPYFLSGLLLRLLMIALFLPHIQDVWFVSFLKNTAGALTLDPWQIHLAKGGDPLAFPYGFIMYLVFLPGTLLGQLLQTITGWAGFIQLGFALTLLAFDMALFFAIERLNPTRRKQAMFLYWLSPIVPFICYWHGQNDIIPITFLVVALAFIKRRKFHYSGVLAGIAVSAKLAMMIPIPIIAIYAWRKGGWKSLMRLVIAFAVFAGAFILPFLSLASVKAMMLQSPEINKIFYATLQLAPNMKIYLTPVVYTLILYLIVKIRRVDQELLVSLIALSFLTILLLAPTSIGWYLWLVPLLVSHYIKNPSAVLGVVALQVVNISFQLMNASGAYIRFFDVDMTQEIRSYLALSEHFYTLWLSASTVSGLVLFIIILRYGVFGNNAFKLARRPILIGISGDSGTGKDTLTRAIRNLFYKNDVVTVSGDDYHLWERGAPQWKKMTHLNPEANDLSKFYNDIMRLREGRDILNKSYDHHTGLFTSPVFVRQRDLVIASGLHALLLPSLRKHYDVKIYMEMNEDLRCFFKIRRDVTERGHKMAAVMQTIKARKADAKRFIQPQKRFADVIFSLTPENKGKLKDYRSEGPIPLALGITLNSSCYYKALAEKLAPYCKVKCAFDMDVKVGAVTMEVSHIHINKAQVAEIARELFPYFQDLLLETPDWQNDVLGIMQLVVIMSLHERLFRVIF